MHIAVINNWTFWLAGILCDCTLCTEHGNTCKEKFTIKLVWKPNFLLMVAAVYDETHQRPDRKMERGSTAQWRRHSTCISIQTNIHSRFVHRDYYYHSYVYIMVEMYSNLALMNYSSGWSFVPPNEFVLLIINIHWAQRDYTNIIYKC